MAAKPLIDRAAVAERLGVNERFVRQLVTDRKIPFVRISTQTVRFDPDAIEQWLEENSKDPVS